MLTMGIDLFYELCAETHLLGGIIFVTLQNKQTHQS